MMFVSYFGTPYCLSSFQTVYSRCRTRFSIVDKVDIEWQGPLQLLFQDDTQRGDLFSAKPILTVLELGLYVIFHPVQQDYNLRQQSLGHLTTNRLFSLI